MKKLSGYICDVCRRYAGYFSDELADWITRVRDEEERHFCSEHCEEQIKVYVVSQAEKNEEPKLS